MAKWKCHKCGYKPFRPSITEGQCPECETTNSDYFQKL